MNQSGQLKISFAQSVSYPSYLKKEIDVINILAQSESTLNERNKKQGRKERRDRRLNIFLEAIWKFVGDPDDN